MNPILMAFLGGLVTWGVTAAGAAMVFFFKEIKPKVLNLMLGFASGIMLAASFWSLLLPALELSEDSPLPWLPVVVGFGFGGLFLFGADKLIPHVHHVEDEPRGGISKVSRNSIRRSVLLVTAITLHNIPEGLSFGIAFGSVGTVEKATTAGAIILVVGIALQNFPEGAAVSIPLRVRSILPYALSFAAGAMVFVVVEELIPESQNDSHLYGHAATIGTMLGFMVMTTLDIALG